MLQQTDASSMNVVFELFVPGKPYPVTKSGSILTRRASVLFSLNQ